MRSIFDITISELETLLVSENFKKYNATQVFEGIYKKQVNSFSEINNISKELKKYLEENFKIDKLEVLEKLESSDTIKYLLLIDNASIECVLMKHNYGNSLCISTQVGCNMGCAFCESGTLKKIRNLSVSEIVLQVITIEKINNIKLDNIVIMGIGEPFDNYDNLIKAIDIFTTNKGMNMGSRRITVSTCGLVPKIKSFALLKTQVNLAISLHASNDKIRNKLMPINKLYNIKEVMEAIDYYIDKTNRKVTIEYILLDGINDSLDNARELANLVKGKLVYVNLIPYNATSHSEFKRCDKEKIDRFYKELITLNVNAIVRREMGKGIKGACGQLRASYEKKGI